VIEGEFLILNLGIWILFSAVLCYAMTIQTPSTEDSYKSFEESRLSGIIILSSDYPSYSFFVSFI